jgi:hypothetical protein
MKLAILEAGGEGGEGGELTVLPQVASKCIRCNMCTLASIDPVKFKAGCVFLKPGEWGDIEDVADIEDALSQGGKARL